jgi:hypothetical protein
MNFLVAQGERDAANGIGVEGHDKELANAFREHKWPHGLFLLLSRITVGYGFHPEWSIVSITIMTLLRAFVFACTAEARDWEIGRGIAYSFDMLLPIIRLRELHYKIDIEGPARYYFYVHRLFGFVLGSF